MEIFDYDDQLKKVRNYSIDVSIKDILTNKLNNEVLIEYRRVLLFLRDNIKMNCLITMSTLICSRININGIDDVWLAIKKCETVIFESQYYLEYYLLELIIYIYDPIPDIIHIGKDVVRKIEDLNFDDENLVDIAFNNITAKKEGILFNNYYLLYNKFLPSSFISHGFLDDLIDYYIKAKTEIKYFGLSINPNVIINADLYMESITKAYIRGPKGISICKLNDPCFPEDVSGTVTEHIRTESDLLLNSTLPLERLETMWSARDNLKSVQIEELIPIDEKKDKYNCRYIHSQWDPQCSSIIHFDSAVRKYTKDSYVARMGSDLKKYRGKSEEYIKLFKINGNIELNTWCSLVTKYLDPDELIVEYMGGYDLTEDQL
jgi:hypothetical protein